MSKSLNDAPFWGGELRTKITHSKSGDIQLRSYLIDHATSKPYTFTGILKTLHLREQEYPNLHDEIEAQRNEIKIKERRRHGATVFSYYASASDETDLAELKQNMKERLEPLARILYRPFCLSAIKNGSFTIKEFVEYIGEAMYISISTDSARKGIRTAMHTKILPAIGSDRIDDYIRSDDAKEKALVRVAAILDFELVKESVRQYTNRALHLLFSALDEYGVPLKGGTYLPRRRFDIGTKKNYDLSKQLVPDHLDNDVREKFLTFLATDSKYLAEFLWLGLIYSGLSRSEIGALHYSDITPYSVLNGEQPTGELIYTCLVTKTLQKTSDAHWRTVDITMKEFVMPKARRIVLVPWLTEVLRRMITALHAAGLEDSDMLLSMGCDGRPNTPDDMRYRIEKSMQDSLLFPPTTIARQRKARTITERYSATVRLLEDDARFVAIHICGMPGAMYHTTFGLAATMTDEQHYLDTLSYDFALCRYYYLRRFYPQVFQFQFTDTSDARVLAIAPSLLQLSVNGDTEKDGELIFETSLGVDIAWTTE